MKKPARHRLVARALSIAVVAMLALGTSGPAQAKDIEFPETGTPAQRVRQLWSATRTHILEDAKAALTDAEYQKRRAPIWGAWSRLQMVTAGDDTAASELIPDVLGLINDTYGWTASSPSARQEVRDRKRRFTPENVAEMDKRVEALK